MMGRPERAKEDRKSRAIGARLAGLTSPPDATAAGLGGFQAAAAMEAFLKNAQGLSSSAASGRTNDPSPFLNGFADPLRALAQNPALLSRITKNVLPRSAPVSSLLPPIPTEGGVSPQVLMALQSHLASIGASPAALLSSGSSTASLGHHSIQSGSDLSAVQQLLAAQRAAAAVPKPSMASSIASSVAAPNMQNWSVERLGQHVNLLHQLKQPIPESVAVLLADARRKEAKKTAKRLANRKSASSSRARKKALVQEMTELNARLKRQAQILALLPDLVITINLEGVITFSSAQVQRVLHHNVDEIVGTKMADLLVPSSREKLNRLIAQLVASEQMAALEVAAAAGVVEVENASGNDTEQVMGASVAEGQAVPAAVMKAESSSEVAVVSEPSFPLSVVKVKAKDGSSDENDNSDNSANSASRVSEGPSSLTRDSVPRSLTATSDEAKSGEKDKACKKSLPSSDISNSSSLSTTAKKLQKANQNLEKNVRAHNKKMKKKGCPSFRDDVTGADVTANNASARLSSLQHRSESSSEEDSGYRESNDSREETSSSASDSSASNGRRKPLAPTCTICLVRRDMVTIWCEVTSSIRTVEIPREAMAVDGVSDDGKSSFKSGAKVGTKSEEMSAPSEPDAPPEKELLLCLRPIRDFEAKKIEGKGFGSICKKKSPSASPTRSESTKPPKKRKQEDSPSEEEPPSKKAAPASDEGDKETDTEVVESLMAMNQQADV
mmetsp:Transcript_797/g.1768  ORF Transcript_797/g.1768 Transcript_797/m.1768 type:complete len:727 (+) Transcript_797:249-2429(+)